MFLGVRIWIWFYFGLSIILFIGVAIYWYRERIRKKYYEFRYPEKLVKVVIHYKSMMYKEYWRIIPDDMFFSIENKKYEFNDKNILKENEFFSKKSKNKTIIKIKGKEYIFEDLLGIKHRHTKYMEMHYFFNNPNPINFNLSEKKLDFSAKQLFDFKENDLFAKLLTLQGERSLMMIILILSIVNIIVSMFLVAKIMGWVE